MAAQGPGGVSAAQVGRLHGGRDTGAGKTTFALRVAAELLADGSVDAVTVICPTEHLKTQWAAAAARVGIHLDHSFRNSDVHTSRDFHGAVLTYRLPVVSGDDVYPRLDEFIAKGHEMRDMDTGEPLSTIRARILSANAYIGAFPLAEALATGADVVIAGRCTDTALALAPMIHRFGWGDQDWDKLAAGTIAGHIVECGAQCTGGNSQVDWQNIPDMANIGYPIVEAEPDGSFTITKHPGTGGRVHSDVLKEQLLYELGDPQQLHHAGLRRRLHQHSPEGRRARIACAFPAFAADRGRRC